MQPGETVNIPDSGDEATPADRSEAGNAQDGDIGGLEDLGILQGDPEKGEDDRLRPIRDIRLTRANHKQECGICYEHIFPGHAIIKAQGLGWVHAGCCRSHISDGETIRLERRNQASSCSSSSNTVRRRHVDLNVMPSSPEEAEEQVAALLHNEEVSNSYKRIGTGVCILLAHAHTADALSYE